VRRPYDADWLQHCVYLRPVRTACMGTRVTQLKFAAAQFVCLILRKQNKNQKHPKINYLTFLEMTLEDFLFNLWDSVGRVSTPRLDNVVESQP
jgi:hypothetical protein